MQFYLKRADMMLSLTSPAIHVQLLPPWPSIRPKHASSLTLYYQTASFHRVQRIW